MDRNNDVCNKSPHACNDIMDAMQGTHTSHMNDDLITTAQIQTASTNHAYNHNNLNHIDTL